MIPETLCVMLFILFAVQKESEMFKCLCDGLGIIRHEGSPCNTTNVMFVMILGNLPRIMSKVHLWCKLSLISLEVHIPCLQIAS